MKRGKILAVVFLSILVISSIANAEVLLTINGIDAAKEFAEIKGGEEIIIAIEGEKEKDVNYFVTPEMGCKIEPITNIESVVKEPNASYLFSFEEEGTALGVVNLHADDDHIYELVLFYTPETDLIIAFGIGYDALHWIPPVEEPLAGNSLATETVEQETIVPDTLQSWRFKPKSESQDKVLMTCPSVQVTKSAITSKEVSGIERAFATTTTTGGEMMSGGTVVDITSDITTNTVWTSDNTYHVLNPVDVNGAMLVIEPGTRVEFATGVSAGIRTLNGAAVISRGTAQNPIVFTSDSATPAYNDYYCPLYITETSSTATEMTYTIVEWAYSGVVVLNRSLDKNIENNYFVNCVYGVVEYGPEHTHIVNNLFFGSYYSGIEVYLASTTGVAEANSVIYIENNTCDYYQDNGITVHGVTANEDAGFVFIANNIVSGSYVAGLNLVDGYMFASVLNTGYYNNVANKNWAFDEINPVVVTANPYETGASGYAPICYLDQSCDFVDAGSLLPELTQYVGKTTATTLVPDGNIADIGFHYPNWDYVNSGEGDYYAGDLDENLVVDFNDFAVLANGWLTTYDMNDLADLCENWLITGGPAPNILPNFDQDPNNLSGYVKVTTSISDPQIHMAWLMIDGEKYGVFGESDYGYSIDVKTEQFTNGIHSAKIVFMYGDSVICSDAVQCTFNNEVSMLIGGDGFTPGEDYHLYGLATGTYLVELVDIINSSTIYSQSFVDGLNAHVSAASFTEEDGAYDLSVKAEAMLLSASWRDVVERIIARKFKKKDYPQGCNVKMVVSVGNKGLERDKKKCWKAALTAAVRKGIRPVYLNAKACTWENLSYCLLLDNVKIWYHCSHGNHDLLGQPPRQCITTASGKVFSYLKKDYDPNNIPPDYEELSWYYENNHSIAELGFVQDTDKMIWVQFNACYSARTVEFPYMLGILPIDDPINIGEQIFIGWKNTALVHDILGNYNQFEEDYWNRLRQGNMLKTAVEDSLPPGGGTNILENFMYYGVIDWQYAWFRYPDIN
ncbi:hypothetical protein L21SP3_00286 [Sedimentisphaera cyanobacteriorum]|uniref:Right handed beta helix domain-containing protein n=1 Tax=Sedimentisphaera cyanobacteriorum TaxID=1940790 RepID=A0A1Q2HMP0_9BACT|nr:right-handed parallel beta-helix repeat-containing protein [Sedimentisphaera cyanobacteriorum]AQQ08503.1 hypothetical protein L21SP3_00286 [Sedimentisphaera cyanobacteriorum]